MTEFNLNDLTEDDLILLENLLTSPAFKLLKKTLEVYRRNVFSSFTTCADSNTMFALQGRIAGLQVVENLPRLLVERRQQKIEKSKVEADLKEKFKLQLPPEQPVYSKPSVSHETKLPQRASVRRRSLRPSSETI